MDEEFCSFVVIMIFFRVIHQKSSEVSPLMNSRDFLVLLMVLRAHKVCGPSSALWSLLLKNLSISSNCERFLSYSVLLLFPGMNTYFDSNFDGPPAYDVVNLQVMIDS